LEAADIIVNLQGDEPLVSPLTIERAVEAVNEWEIGEEGNSVKGKGERGTGEIGMVTTWEPIESAAEVLNPDVVKIAVDGNRCAVYFSRSPVPYPRDAIRRHGSLEVALENEPALLTGFRKHTGLYVYRRDVLLAFAKWPQSELERLESLEQLRALENGVRIKAIEASTPSIGVDTIDDLERVRSIVEDEVDRRLVV
jgi:3-deoxy-manno-octulosonate cytidylyltransferase (CMP-KDO synthetase)